MTVIVWIAEGTWPTCVDAARTRAPGADLVLLHVSGHEVPGAAHGAFAGLLGRARPIRDPGDPARSIGAPSSRQQLLTRRGRGWDVRATACSALGPRRT